MCISLKGCNHFNTKTGWTDEKKLWDLASWLVGNLWLDMLCKTRKGLQLLSHRNLHTRFQLSQFALIVFNWSPPSFNSIPTNQQAPTHSFLDSIIKSKNQGTIFYNLKTITNHNAQFFTANHKVHDEVQEWNPVLEQKKRSFWDDNDDDGLEAQGRVLKEKSVIVVAWNLLSSLSRMAPARWTGAAHRSTHLWISPLLRLKHS
jgi:hypothetical protein